MGFPNQKMIDWKILNCISHYSYGGVLNNKITSNSDLKYGLQADRTILWALHVCPSHANVTCFHKIALFIDL